MTQKRWFKIFIWFMASLFFFLATVVIISLFRPGPSETETMKFMESMMGAMDRSMMGVAMGIEKDSTLKSVIVLSAYIITPVLIISILSGILIRLKNREDK